MTCNFCPKACRLVDEFHRKTVNEEVEWMLYFDYMTGDVVYCWKGEEDSTGGEYDRIHLKSRNIASLHNHPKKLYSFPSLDNFDILKNDFEDYEIICANSSFWKIESKGILENEIMEQIISDLYDLFQQVNIYIFLNFKNNNQIGRIIDEMYSNQIINYLNTNYKIYLLRRSMLEMLLNNQEVSLIEYPLSDTDPRMNKEWMMNHIDEIRTEISKNDSNPCEDLIKLNEKLNIDIDFEQILQKFMNE